MESEDKHIDIDLLTRYLAGETSPEEKHRIEEWIALSEENRKELDDMRKIWDKVGSVPSEFPVDIEKEWKYHKTKIGREKVSEKRFSLRPVLKIAASVILIVTLSLTGYFYLKGKTVTTQLAETRSVALPDGTMVTLNASSKLHYDRKFNKQYRQVSLEGEAFFQVHKDASKPFIISTGQAEIKVLGTSFNVKAYKSMEVVELVVAEGVVSLYAKNKPDEGIKATAGARAIFNRKSLQISKQPNTDRNFISWKTHIMVFDNDRLDAVMTLIGEVYSKKIEFANPALRDCTLTTRFRSKNLPAVINVLESTLGISIQISGDTLIVSGDGC